MVGIIYGSTKQAAEQKLDDMIAVWVRQGIKIKYLSKAFNGDKIILDNGECWRTAIANAYARGLRCNVALIDRNIPQEIIETVIMPVVTDPTWNAIGYY